MIRAALLAAVAASLATDTRACLPAPPVCLKKVFMLDRKGWLPTTCERIGAPRFVRPRRAVGPGSPLPVGSYGGMECFTCGDNYNAGATLADLSCGATVPSLGGGTTSLVVIPTDEQKFEAWGVSTDADGRQVYKPCDGAAIYAGDDKAGADSFSVYLNEVKLSEECFEGPGDTVVVVVPTFRKVPSGVERPPPDADTPVPAPAPEELPPLEAAEEPLQPEPSRAPFPRSAVPAPFGPPEPEPQEPRPRRRFGAPRFGPVAEPGPA